MKLPARRTSRKDQQSNQREQKMNLDYQELQKPFAFPTSKNPFQKVLSASPVEKKPRRESIGEDHIEKKYKSIFSFYFDLCLVFRNLSLIIIFKVVF